MDNEIPARPRVRRRQVLTALTTVCVAAVAGACLTRTQERTAALRKIQLPPKPSVPREIHLDDLPLPPRRASALSGSQFIDKTHSMSFHAREAAVLEEVLSGNVPAFLRTLVPVEICGGHAQWRHKGEVHVAADYLCIGSDDDFIRMPMNGRTAQRVASALGCVLPTPKLVDAIYDQAAVRLTSSPMPHGAKMMSSEYFREHNRDIESHRARVRGRLGDLTAGHKKDVVLSRRLEYQPGHLAIYGWHRDNHIALQLLSTFHEDTYVDYTHGVRLVSAQMTVEGEPRQVMDVLRDVKAWSLLSLEGPIHATYAT